MTEKAKKRIEEAIKTKVTELDLSGCELIEIPKEIEEITRLFELNLNDNQINATPPLPPTKARQFSSL